jgi:hypothetical protein
MNYLQGRLQSDFSLSQKRHILGRVEELFPPPPPINNIYIISVTVHDRFLLCNFLHSHSLGMPGLYNVSMVYGLMHAVCE